MTAAKEKSALLVKDHDVVVPGEVLAQGMEYLPSQGTYRKDENIYANQTGLLIVEGKVLKTIPLASAYLPKKYDVIIGRVQDILMTGWRIDTNSPYSAVLPLKDATFDYIKKGADLTAFFNIDEYVVCKIFQVTSQNLVDVSMKGPGLRKLQGGRIIKVNAAKVPRLIGKRGSMVMMIKSATGIQLIVGQNGIVWLNGDPEQEVLAIEAIRKIEEEAHVPGLTERMKKWLEKKTGKKIEIQEMPEEESYDHRPPRRDGPRRDGPRRDGPRRDSYRGPRRDGPSGPRRDGPRRGPPRR
ncbi:RNA-binding protein [Candidatus Woesearchaeota archaeon]|nr:RNA-binding protein [Candidatus Woesearchaeota archaeon]